MWPCKHFCSESFPSPAVNVEFSRSVSQISVLQVLLHVLFEHAAGYALFAVKEVEEIGMLLPQVSVCVCFFCGVVLLLYELDSLSVCVWQVEESVLSLGKFNSMVSLAAFFPFKSAQAALENMNAISEGLCVTAAAGERRTSSAELHQLDLLRQFPVKNSPRSDLLFSDIFLRVP